jgi:predicted secreted protein
VRPISLIALYVSLYALALLLVLPFGIKPHTSDDDTTLVPGQADGAPAHFDARRTFVRAGILGTILFALVYLNAIYGWITPTMLDVMGNSGS